MKAARRTPLYNLHKKLGARLTEFAGFEMPVSYGGIIEEHLAVRGAAGIFDVSHMGEFEVRGGRAAELLERTLTNSAARLEERAAQYTLMCLDNGGVIDDLIVYRLGGEHFMMCVNAGNIASDREWLLEHNNFGAEFRDVSDETALVSVQGPQAMAIIQQLTTVDLTGLRPFHLAVAEVAGTSAIVARTGYTGEDGFELFVPAASGTALFEALLDAGRPRGMKPCGLGARDTLRLEAGLPLYGHELDRDTTPLEAGLGRFVRHERDFVGAAALRAQLSGKTSKRLLGITTDDGRSIARQGYLLLNRGEAIGSVTSGSFAPTFGRPLAMGYIRTADGAVPDKLEVEIRASRVAATVTALPFYRRAAESAAVQSNESGR